MKTAIGGIGDWFGDIGTRFQEIGASLVSAVDGIKSRFVAVKETVGGLAVRCATGPRRNSA